MSSRANTYERLIQATIDVIDQRGEAAVRMGEIAAAAGIKQPSIYHFFEDREQLVVAAHRERYRRAVMQALGPFDSTVPKATTKEEFFRFGVAGLRHAFDAQRSAARSVRITLLSKALTNEGLMREVNDASYEATRRLAELVAEGQRKGWVRRDFSPLTIATWIRSLIFGRFVPEVDPERYDGDEWTELAITSIVHTLMTPPDGAG